MRLWKRIVCIGLLCIGLLCGGPAFSQGAGLPGIGPAGPYRIGPGDVLEITVFEVEELSKPATVGPRGILVLPLLGEVEVQGLTPLEVAGRLEELYGESLLRDPQISVEVRDYRSQPVSVLGAVERPGIYQLQGRRRLLEVLAIAGGLANNSGDEIRITRHGSDLAAAMSSTVAPAPGAEAAAGSPPVVAGNDARTVEEIAVSIRRLLTDPGETPDNPWIEPYDVIRVAETGLVYVLGAVERPGGYPIERESMTVLRAISLAQGLGRRAAPQKARVIRQQGGGKQEILVPIGDILRGEAFDAPLEDNDILFVPDSRAKSALHRGAEAAIQLATGVIIWRR
jgi:polysaccharide export outer membrane protein